MMITRSIAFGSIGLNLVFGKRRQKIQERMESLTRRGSGLNPLLPSTEKFRLFGKFAG